ncbi:uncharacterized protein FIBRA_08983 [Fibroporia radiculosa]|uniref:Fucose-specific lectin n=1 Tax=Fibroporia radiculosa TaxID=599839 RepID=J4ICN0_9APHY|nr:uncharacterized protein FIBRA_08983 [Fibroporia radiculosa]CCM06696.1 predicted protein [Fibroporia radiculosa]
MLRIRVYYVATNNVLVELAWNGTKWVNGYPFPASDYTVADGSNLLYARVNSNTGSTTDIHVGFQQQGSAAIVEAHHVGPAKEWVLETLQ